MKKQKPNTSHFLTKDRNPRIQEIRKRPNPTLMNEGKRSLENPSATNHAYLVFARRHRNLKDDENISCFLPNGSYLGVL